MSTTQTTTEGAAIMATKAAPPAAVSLARNRHSEGNGWRQRVAIAIRSALLDNIDPNGVHHG